MSARPNDFQSEDVAQVFAAWPVQMREKILRLRGMIFDVANATDGVGTLVETLKWNVPAYLTQKPKSGTTIRLEGKTDTGQYGLYVSCSTTLIEQCRELYQERFSFQKNRGLLFEPDEKVPENELRHFIAMALTYHVKPSSN